LRVALVYFNAEDNKPLLAVISKTVQEQGHNCALVNGNEPQFLTSYDFLIILYGKSNLFSAKISDNVSRFLQGAGTVAGKKSLALVTNKGLFKERCLANLMKVMEAEALFIVFSKLLKSNIEASLLIKGIFK